MNFGVRIHSTPLRFAPVFAKATPGTQDERGGEFVVFKSLFVLVRLTRLNIQSCDGLRRTNGGREPHHLLEPLLQIDSKIAR